jgi:hypothetical protein
MTIDPLGTRLRIVETTGAAVRVSEAVVLPGVVTRVADVDTARSHLTIANLGTVAIRLGAADVERVGLYLGPGVLIDFTTPMVPTPMYAIAEDPPPPAQIEIDDGEIECEYEEY